MYNKDFVQNHGLHLVAMYLEQFLDLFFTVAPTTLLETVGWLVILNKEP